jgi:hypothetical protein
MNYKFILTATLTFIPYTVLWFFWHNNLFYSVYYILDYFRTTQSQNVWLMNFANALLVYGFVYFYWGRSQGSRLNVVLWGVYYNISVIGFFNFMMLGTMSEWNLYILIFDMLWALTGGVLSGLLAFYLKKKISP